MFEGIKNLSEIFSKMGDMKTQSAEIQKRMEMIRVTGNAGAGNQGFLSKTVAAQASLEATNASISSDTAIQMSKLDTAEQMQLQQAIKDNTGGI